MPVRNRQLSCKRAIFRPLPRPFHYFEYYFYALNITGILTISAPSFVVTVHAGQGRMSEKTPEELEREEVYICFISIVFLCHVLSVVHLDSNLYYFSYVP